MLLRRWFQRICSRRVLVVLLAVLALGLGGRHAWAWYQFLSGRAALKRYQPAEALTHLSRCLDIWPSSVQVHLLASQAARQGGDFAEADRHLRFCQQQNGGTTEAIALEWALLQAANSNLREVEEYLQRQAELNPEVAPLVWEAVAEGYTNLYRMLDALPCLERWLAVDPNNLRALELRGKAYQIGKQPRKAIPDLRQVLERDPNRKASRWRLVLCLLDAGSYDEALSHLEYLERLDPEDAEVQIRLARCHNMTGQSEKAREVLDAVLKAHPDNALALRTRGQFALADRQPAEAERWLTQAAELRPTDYQTQWLLLQALQQQPSKAEQARTQLRQTERVKLQAERFGELTTRKLFEQPLDPALHHEMGVLLMRRGQQAQAEGWFQSALSLNPNYQPSHAALADIYESQGDKKRAEEHRRQSGDKVKE